MKKFYTLTVIVLSVILCINTASAQTYSGGTYTAVRSGNWHTPSGINIWDVSGEPSSTCTSCLIIINPGVSVLMNSSIILTGNSLLNIQLGSQVNIPYSGGNSFSTSYNVMLDAYSQASIFLSTTTSIIQVTTATTNPPAAGEYDGVFSFGVLPNLPGHIGQQKIIGNAPSYFIDGDPEPFNYQSLPSLTGVRSIGGNGTLPLLLNSFTASLNSINDNVNLAWNCSDQVNFSHFTVQRSIDGITWKDITTINAENATGSSINYAFTDLSPSSGVNYYRLMMVDINGKYIYSTIVLVRGSVFNGVKVFPNPAKSYVNVSLGNDITANQVIRLTDMYGKVLQEKQVSNAAGTTLSLPVGNYAKGIYLLHVKSADGSQQVYKVFVSQD